MNKVSVICTNPGDNKIALIKKVRKLYVRDFVYLFNLRTSKNWSEGKIPLEIDAHYLPGVLSSSPGCKLLISQT